MVRRKLADGTVREYHYSREAVKTSKVAPDTVDALIVAYKRSPQWTGLKSSSRKNYSYYLRDISEIGHMPVKEVKRRILLTARDAIAAERGTGAANTFMRVASALFKWARDRDWIEHTPLDRVRLLQGGHLLAWTSEEADRAIAELPADLARVVLLARYTGQRRGDLINMTWRAYDGHSIQVQQEKGRGPQNNPPISIPVHPVLKAALDSWPRTRFEILTTSTGIPWTRDHLTQAMRRAVDALGMRAKLNVHGLRKLAATSLAEAGCSTHEIAAITGHRSLKMVELYTASVSQKHLAEAAIFRLENARRKTDGKRQ